MKIPHYSTFIAYDNPFWQVLMLADEARNEAYRQAIRKVISGGEVVADVGAGTGMWGRYAIKCGAKRVYMVEREERLIPMIRVLNRQFPPGADIVVLHGDASAVELPEKVDVVISELMGGLVFDEDIVEVLSPFKRTNAKERCVFIPSSLDVWAQPILVSELNGSEEISSILASDFEAFGVTIPDQPKYWAILDPHVVTLLEQPKRVFFGSPQDLKEPPMLSATWNFAAAMANPRKRLGVAVWFDAEMSDGVRFGNGPSTLPTSWGVTVVPVDDTELVTPSSKVRINLNIEAVGERVQTFLSQVALVA
jgi:precorrin-6B methylase 2